MPSCMNFSFEDKHLSKRGKIGRGIVKKEHLFANTQAASIEPDALPFDPALPGTALLHQPTQLREILSRLLVQWLGPDAHLLNSRAYLRRLSPGKRCSIELELVIGRENGVPAERRRLLAKIYSEDQGSKVYETLRELRCHGFGTGRFIVPQPLAYESESHLLLLTWAEGELLRSVLLARSDASQEIAAAAEWLLSLHKCGVRTGRRYSFLAHLHTLAGWKELLTEIYPEGERLLGALLTRFEESGRKLSGWTPGPTHRDFSPEHLVVHGAQLTGLDFDEFCQYDPLFDVAHFTVHLRFLGLTHFGTLNHFDWLADRFLAAYEAGGGDYSRERLGLYEAIAYFKLGRFVTLVQRPQGWRQILSELLGEARRLV